MLKRFQRFINLRPFRKRRIARCSENYIDDCEFIHEANHGSHDRDNKARCNNQRILPRKDGSSLAWLYHLLPRFIARVTILKCYCVTIPNN